MATHELAMDARVLHGHFSRDLEPVLTVDPGDSVRFSTPDAGWYVAPDERFVPRDDEEYRGHALAGPIEVRGARAGQTLAVRIDEVRPAEWGTTIADEQPIRWELDGSAAGSRVLHALDDAHLRADVRLSCRRSTRAKHRASRGERC